MWLSLFDMISSLVIKRWFQYFKWFSIMSIHNSNPALFIISIIRIANSHPNKKRIPRSPSVIIPIRIAETMLTAISSAINE